MEHCQITRASGEVYQFWCLTHRAPAIHTKTSEYANYLVCYKYAEAEGCQCCPDKPLEELFEKASGLFAELSEVFAAIAERRKED